MSAFNKYTINNHYQIVGLENGVNRPLIWLIHGAGGDLYHFNTVTSVLINRGYRVLLTDVRFHGRSQLNEYSDSQSVTFDFADVISDMDIVLAEVKCKYYPTSTIQLFLGGFSMGGMISLLYIECKNKNKDWYGVVLKGIITIAAGIPYLPISRTKTWGLYAERKATEKDLEWTRPAIIESALTNEGKQEVKRALDLISNHALFECMVAISKNLPYPSDHQDPYELLTREPMLIIVPEQDKYTKPELELLHKMNLKQGIDSELVTIMNADHMVILDKGNEVGEVMAKFCLRISALGGLY
jgi:pimeloyl-ACP methyl ester carboxylesterase